MQIFNVTISSDAQNDLASIIEYLNKFSPAIGAKYYDLISNKILSLQKMPLRLPVVRDERLTKEQVRWIFAKNYVIFFVADRKTSVVDVKRILYSSMAFDVLL